MRTAIVCVIAMVSASVASAQTNCAVKADVYYINGVDNPDPKKTREQLNRLQSGILNFSASSGSIRNINLLYNHSNGLLFDLVYEFSRQKSLEMQQDIARLIVSYGMTALGYAGYASDADASIIKQRVAEIIGSQLPPTARVEVDSYKSIISTNPLLAGYQAVVVAHSQGNMFANTVFDELKYSTPERYFRGLGIVNVANPAARAPSSLYVTVYEDIVIKGLSILNSFYISPPLPANLSATGAQLFDFQGHGFSEIYMSLKLPFGTTSANSVAAVVVGKIDAALSKTSTFFDSPNFILDSGGNRIPRPAGLPTDSSVVQICFPQPVGGL